MPLIHFKGTLSIAEGEQLTRAQENEIVRNFRQVLRPYIKTDRRRSKTQSFFEADHEKKKVTIVVEY